MSELVNCEILNKEIILEYIYILIKVLVVKLSLFVYK